MRAYLKPGKIFYGALLLLPQAFGGCGKEIQQTASQKEHSFLTVPAYNIVNSLPAGYVTDGSVDYTSYIQPALDSHTDIEFPGFPILVNDTGLRIHSNKTITFLPGSELWMKPSNKNVYGVIRIDTANNITLNSPVIKGDRYTHLVTTGEWGMGILMYSCGNVTINDAKISDCWGDGICLGRSSISNHNISINNAWCNNNRRDGITVGAVDTLSLVAPYVSNTNGTLPMAGINFEPNSSADDIKNVTVNNPVTVQNQGNGIQFGLDNLLKPSATKTVSATIINHKDSASGKISFVVSCYRRDSTTTGTVTGNINMVNPDWKNPVTKRAFQYWATEPGLQGTVSTPQVMINNVYKTTAQMQVLFPSWINAGNCTITY